MSLNYTPFAENEDLQRLRHELWTNVNPSERAYSVLGGLALIATGIASKGTARWASWTAGIALVYRGASGHCALYDRIGIWPKT